MMQINQKNAVELGAITMLGSEGVMSDSSVAFSLIFLGLVWIPVAVMSALLLFNLHDWWLPFEVIAGLAIILLWILLFGRVSRKNQIQFAAVQLACIIASGMLSIYVYDTSWDGRWYHADAILGILHGINPIYGYLPGYIPVWANHYPKGTWYFSAGIIHIFHNYQLGKVYNLLLICSTVCYTSSFYMRNGIKGKRTLLLVAITALSPVVCSQVVTYYVDGAMASLLTLAICSVINILYKPQRYDRLVFILSASLAMSIKFTGPVYIGVIVLLWVSLRCISVFKKAQAQSRGIVWADVITMFSSFLVGISLLGFDPYLTNIMQGFHPLYPLMGQNKIDILWKTTPPILLERPYNEIQKFIISLFSKSYDVVKNSGTTLISPASLKDQLKIPFEVTKNELLNLRDPETHLGGWGIFFSGVLIASLTLFVGRKGWRGDTFVLVAILMILACTFINPECWWARYSPQLALVPVFLLVPFIAKTTGWESKASIVIGVILLVNNLLFAVGGIGISIVRGKILNQSLKMVEQKGGRGEYWIYPVSFPKEQHYDQFSGYNGIILCGEINPDRYPIPKDGYPLSMQGHQLTEVILLKESCSAPLPKLY